MSPCPPPPPRSQDAPQRRANTPCTPTPSQRLYTTSASSSPSWRDTAPPRESPAQAGEPPTPARREKSSNSAPSSNARATLHFSGVTRNAVSAGPRSSHEIQAARRPVKAGLPGTAAVLLDLPARLVLNRLSSFAAGATLRAASRNKTGVSSYPVGFRIQILWKPAPIQKWGSIPSSTAGAPSRSFSPIWVKARLVPAPKTL